MPRFLIDANLPFRFAFWNTADYEPVPDTTWTDTKVWAYASEKGLFIITKDIDYEVLVANRTPPKVVRLCIGNLKKRDLWILLERVWPVVLLAPEKPSVRLVRIYRTRLEIA